MPAKIGQQAVEILYAPSVPARLSQCVAEVLYLDLAMSPTTVTGAGVSQCVAEVLCAPSATVVVSQDVVEILLQVTDQVPAPPAGEAGVRVFGYAG